MCVYSARAAYMCERSVGFAGVLFVLNAGGYLSRDFRRLSKLENVLY